jgi:hypothetical protein
MSSVEVEEYENGGVFVKVYTYQDPPRKMFTLRIGGCCYLEVREPELIALWEFLDVYMNDSNNKPKKRWWNRGR